VADEYGLEGLNQRADELIDELRSVHRPRLVVISGPSGVGKDSVIEHMRLELPEHYYAVTATTRQRRPGEIDGVHYYFLSQADFETQVEAGEFLEHAVVYGNLYGVPKARVRSALHAGKSVVVKVDVQGARSIRELVPQAIRIFLAPPDMAELLRRLRGRKSDDFDEVMRRLSTATNELTSATEFDYVVFNESDRIPQTVASIATIIEAELMRVHQPEVTL
jgi:guanylate kinase